jgi:hypothetical protein
MTGAHERWEQMRTLFDHARALPVSERSAWLDSACRDADLRSEVDALLEAHALLEGGTKADFLAHLDGIRTAALLESDEETAAPHDPEAGDTIGRYRIVRRLGQGGMGVVYLAEDLRLRRHAALKLLPHHLNVDVAARGRFEQEARAASALDHPNIVTVYEIGDAADGRLYIAMAFCEGVTLRELMDGGPLPAPLAVRLAVQVADGLAAAHRRGIVHRDVKPQNILVTDDNVARIVDFGIAKMAGSALTQTSVTPGTIAYMSPERTRGQASDPRADVWSLGAVLYEMLAGRRPFEADSDQALVFAIRNDEPEPLDLVRTDVSAELSRIVQRCLAKDAEERYRDAEALLRELRMLSPESDGHLPIASARVNARQPSAAGAWRLAHRVAVLLHNPLAKIAAVVVVLGAVVLAVHASFAQPHLEARRVAIGSIENRTGSQPLDDVASMAGDWIAHGLWQTGLIDVIPLPTTEAGASVTARAKEARAGLLVTGAMYREGDVIRLQARIADLVTGRMAASVDPVEAREDALMDGVDELSRRVQSALYPRLDTVITHVRAVERPPRFEAYREYLAGRESHSARDLPGALRHFERATELDTTFLLPQVIAAVVMNMMGNQAGADSISRRLERVRDRLDPISRAHADWLRGTLSGDRQSAYAGMRAAARYAPGSTLVNYQLAHETVSIGRPREALELLNAVEPERGELRGWIGYWQVLTAAHHLVGDHRRELREAQRARSLYPDDPRAVIVQLGALAASGRTKQISELLDEAVAMPAPKEPNPGALMLNTALELRAHAAGRQARSRRAAADTILARAIAWYQSRPAEQQSVRERYEVTMALAAVGRRAEAREALALLVNTPLAGAPGPSPFASNRSPNYPDEVAYNGSLGVLAALDADTATAAAALSWLEEFRGPYARGRPTYWRAAITAARGEPQQAVALLRQALREGIPASLALHHAPELASLRDYAPFQSLVAVKR